MGLVDHRRHILCPFLFPAEIYSGPTVHIILDFSDADSYGRVADCKRELELGFLPQEGSVVELCALCALSSLGVDSCGSSASYSQPTFRLVCPLHRISRICNLVGLPSLASQQSETIRNGKSVSEKPAERVAITSRSPQFCTPPEWVQSLVRSRRRAYNVGRSRTTRPSSRSTLQLKHRRHRPRPMLSRSSWRGLA